MTFRASRDGATVREVPITFRDRRVGQSKMSRRIVVEALVVVVQLRADELRGRFTRRGPGAGSPIAAASPATSHVPAADPDGPNAMTRDVPALDVPALDVPARKGG